MSDSASGNGTPAVVGGALVVIGLIAFGVIKSRNGEPKIEPSPEQAADRVDGGQSRQSATSGEHASGGEPQGAYIAKTDLKDAGMGTPEKALRTYIKAMLDNDIDRMAAAMPSDKAQQFTNLMNTPALAGDLQAAMTNTLIHQRPGYRIAETKAISEDEKVISVRFGSVDHTLTGDPSSVFTLRKIQGQWKVAENNPGRMR